MTAIQFVSHESDSMHPRDMNQSVLKKASMEEEIRQLRSKMEVVFQLESSFTSKAVIQLSTQLDEKINEYNAFMRRYINS